jgi:hypothetical protein
MRNIAMADPPILDECRALLNELDQVEKRISRLAGEMVDSVVAQGEEDVPQIEGLVDAQSEAEEEFAALRVRIVKLGKSYGLCPEHVPDEGYSLSGLRGLLQGIQRIEQGFKQPAPESLDVPWEQIPSDLLDSLDAQAKQTAELLTEFRSAGERLPSDVERFLDRVISEANRAVLSEAKLPGETAASLPSTSAQQRQTTARRRPKASPPKDSQQPGQFPPQHSQVSGSVAPVVKEVPVEAPPAQRQAAAMPEQAKAAAAREAPAAPIEVSAPPPGSVSLPEEVVEAAAAAEKRFQQDAATSDWKPARMASDRDYQDLLEYGEGKLGLGRAEFADLLANLALLNHKQGRFADSEELHKKELMIREKELGQDHPKVATSLNNLALLCRDLGRHQEARALWERSLAIVEKAFGPEHPKVALRLSNLADLLHGCGETAEAEQYYKRLLALREAGNVGKKREVKSSLRKYAELLRSTSRKREAGKVEAQIATPRPGWFSKWR